MIGVLNLALPYFGLIFIGFVCGKRKDLPESGLAWMNFFLLYVSLPALFFRVLAKTPFKELNNLPFIISTTLGTSSAFTRLHARVTHRQIDRTPLMARGFDGGAGGRLRQYRLYGAGLRSRCSARMRRCRWR